MFIISAVESQLQVIGSWLSLIWKTDEITSKKIHKMENEVSWSIS